MATPSYNKEKVINIQCSMHMHRKNNFISSCSVCFTPEEARRVKRCVAIDLYLRRKGKNLQEFHDVHPQKSAENCTVIY